MTSKSKSPSTSTIFKSLASTKLPSIIFFVQLVPNPLLFSHQHISSPAPAAPTISISPSPSISAGLIDSGLLKDKSMVSSVYS